MTGEMKRWMVLLAVVLFFTPLFAACGGKGGSTSGPTSNGSISPEALALLKTNFGVRPDGSVTRWGWNTISYSVEDDNEALSSAADAAAGFWNGVGAVSLRPAPKGQGNIKVFIGSSMVPPFCGGYGISGGPSFIESGEVAIRSGCENVMSVAHEMGHVLGIFGHTYCGVMIGSPPNGPDCGGGPGLFEGPPGLFEALRYVYSRPPGTRLV